MTILCLVALGKLLANRASVTFHPFLDCFICHVAVICQHLFHDHNSHDDAAVQVARVERVRQILGGQLGTAGNWADKLGTAGTWHTPGQLPDKESSAQLTQPMLAGISHHMNGEHFVNLPFICDYQKPST